MVAAAAAGPRGTTPLLLDHVVKDREAWGRYAIGAQAKLALIGGAAYRLDVVQPFGRGREGVVKVTVTKDKPGHVRALAAEGGRVAELHLDSEDDGAVVVRLEPPATGASGEFRPTHLMERVSRAIEDGPGLAKTAIRSKVEGNNHAKDLAIEVLVAEGHVATEQDGQARRMRSIKPYRETDEEAGPAPLPEPCPNPAPAGSESTPAPLPASLGAGGGVHGGRSTADPAPAVEEVEA